MSQSKSDILRRAIYKAIDGEVDLSGPSQRHEFEQNFRKSHPDFDCDRTLFVKIYKECFKNRNLDLEKAGLTRKKTPQYDTELAAKLHEQAKESKTEQTAPEQPPMETPKIQENVAHAIKYNHWTVSSVGALFRGFLAPLQEIWPEMELSKDTIDPIAEMWIPTLQRFGSEKVQYLVLPAIAATEILASHIHKAHRLHKEQSN